MDPAARALGNVAVLTLAPTLDLDLRPYTGAVQATIAKENDELLAELRAEVFGTADALEEAMPAGVGEKVLVAVRAVEQPGLKPLTEELTNKDYIAYLVAIEQEDMKGGGPLTALLSTLADIEATLD